MFKPRLLASAFAVPLALLATSAAADGPEFSFEALITSDLIRSGESLTNGQPGAALEAEVALAGFFAGLELLTLRDGDDRLQAELFLGYRWELDLAELEFGVARAWADDSGMGDTEIFAGLEVPLGEAATLGFEAVYAPRPREWADVSATATFALSDQWEVSATLGRAPADRLNYGNIGVSYAFTEQAAFDLRVHNSREIGSRVTASLVFALGGN